MIVGNHDTDHRALIIAEIGNNHEGDFGRAREMVAAAAEAGADAIKFQTIVPDRLVSATQPERIAQLSRFQLSREQFTHLAQTCAENQVMFLSTAFDLDSLAFLAPLMPAVKIASPDNTFIPLLDAAAAMGKPILLSCGLCDAEEVQSSMARIRATWGAVDPGLALLHCVSAYPTPPDQAGLSAIRTLAALGGTPGYSDHTLGIEAAVLSVACGARIIEKHFTLDKHLSDFRDHQLSADPAEMANLVSRVRQAETLLGSEKVTCAPAEHPGRTAFRRSIVAATDLSKGTVLTTKHLDWVRPGNGLAPGQEETLLGKALNRALTKGETILQQDVI